MKAIFTLDDTITAGGGHAIYTSLHNIENPGQYLLICPPGELAGKIAPQVKVETISKKRHKLSLVRNLRRILSQYSEIKTLHVHGISALPIAVMAVAGKKITLEYTEHLLNKDYTLSSRLRQAIQRFGYFFLIRFCSHIYCVSESVQEFITKKFWIPKRKTSVVYNVIPRYQSEPKIHTQLDTIKLVSVGSLNTVKYFEGLIQVMTQLPAHYHLSIIGEGEKRIELAKLVTGLGLDNRISLLGNVEHNEVIEIMNKSDIYCSTSKSESFGYTIAEAMAVGLPVVAFHVGGIPELVRNEETGLLVTPYDLIGYADAVKRLGADVNLRARYGKAGFNFLERFQRTQLYIS